MPGTRPGMTPEIDMMSNDATASITRINPPELGTPPGYSQIVEVAASRIIFIAGQTALDRDGNVVGKGDFAAQATQVFHNLAIALQASGCSAANLVKLTVFLTDMNNLSNYREARNTFFASVTPPAAPAVTLVEVSKLYGADFMIEIEAIAAG
jgi:enamine deaminase RidA (YjgF/YER057c/UK114 family)